MKFPWEIPTSITRLEAVALAGLAKGRLLEIGSQWGFSTILLASRCDHLTAVDWHQGDFHAGFMPTASVYYYNLCRYDILSKVNTICAKVEDVADSLPHDLDGVFVDAAHDEESARAHWDIVCPLVKEGGWIAFHDYGRFGVTNALREPDRLVESLAVYQC